MKKKEERERGRPPFYELYSYKKVVCAVAENRYELANVRQVYKLYRTSWLVPS